MKVDIQVVKKVEFSTMNKLVPITHIFKSQGRLTTSGTKIYSIRQNQLSADFFIIP